MAETGHKNSAVRVEVTQTWHKNSAVRDNMAQTGHRYSAIRYNMAQTGQSEWTWQKQGSQSGHGKSRAVKVDMAKA